MPALTARWISKTAGFVLDRAVSRCLIPSFIRNNNIDLSEYQPEKYRSYNACFTRKVRPECRPMDMQGQHLISPCDAKLSVYPITEDACFSIKGGDYTVSDLLDGDDVSVEEKTIRTLTLEQVLAAFTRLPDAYKEVLRYKYLLDLNDREIAKLLGVRKNSVRVYLMRARKAVLELCKEDADEKA